MADHKLLEEGTEVQIDFGKLNKVAAGGKEVIPVVVQDADTLELLIVAYVDETALDYTLEHMIAAFWSTSRKELWVKGLTSGDTLEVVEVWINCEQNSLLYLVRPTKGGACHTKAKGATRKSCYYRQLVVRDGVKVLEHVAA